MKISIIIPWYNEEEVLPLTFERLNSLCVDLLSNEDCDDVEFVMVDDGSQDRTAELLAEASNVNKRFKLIRFSRNFGHQAALLAGYEFAKGDVIVSLDADLQDPPELIKTMLEKIKEGNDVVYAARQSRKNDSWFKCKTADLFYWLMKKFGADIIPNHADFRMVTRRALNAFLQFHENNLFIRATFPIVGFPSCVVYYDRPEPRKLRYAVPNSSHLNLLKDIWAFDKNRPNTSLAVQSTIGPHIHRKNITIMTQRHTGECSPPQINGAPAEFILLSPKINHYNINNIDGHVKTILDK